MHQLTALPIFSVYSQSWPIIRQRDHPPDTDKLLPFISLYLLTLFGLSLDHLNEPLSFVSQLVFRYFFKACVLPEVSGHPFVKILDIRYMIDPAARLQNVCIFIVQGG